MYVRCLGSRGCCNPVRSTAYTLYPICRACKERERRRVRLTDAELEQLKYELIITHRVLHD